ncbi:MAG: zinc ribbon domain-containing protein [Myxococcaceae bacterium]
MTIHAAVRRLHNDLQHLRHSKQEHKSDVRDLKHDRRELGKDRNELKRDVKDGKQLHRILDRDRRDLKNDINGKQSALGTIETKRQEILDRYNSDGFDSVLPGVMPNPLMTAELQALDQQRTDVTARFDEKIAGDRTDIQEGKADILGKRAEIKHDRKDMRHDRKKAMHDLRPAEYHMGLKATNRARHELGLKSVDHVIRPVGPGNVSSTMKRLASAARSAAMSMGGYSSQGLCATGVSKAIRNAMGISVYGNGNQIDNNLPRDKFKEVKNMSLAQALKIPGMILTWERTSTSLGSIYGHTAITTGDGHTSASDFIESNTLAGSSGRSGLRIFMPRS